MKIKMGRNAHAYNDLWTWFFNSGPYTADTTSPETTLPNNAGAVILDEYFRYLTSDMELHIFILMFGEDCVRYTQQKSYAIVQRESGEEYFVFFDKKDRLDHVQPVDSGVFHSNEEFLDYILGNSPTMNEMSAYDNFLTGIGDVEAYYTQEGVFLIVFPYSTIYIDEIPQGTERRLKVIAYYDYEDLDTEEELYSDGIWYILPEDRNRYNGQ